MPLISTGPTWNPHQNHTSVTVDHQQNVHSSGNNPTGIKSGFKYFQYFFFILLTRMHVESKSGQTVPVHITVTKGLVLKLAETSVINKCIKCRMRYRTRRIFVLFCLVVCFKAQMQEAIEMQNQRAATGNKLIQTRQTLGIFVSPQCHWVPGKRTRIYLKFNTGCHTNILSTVHN